MNQQEQNRADVLLMRTFNDKDWPLLVQRMAEYYFNAWKNSGTLGEREDAWHEYKGFRRFATQLEVTNGKIKKRETVEGERSQGKT